LVLVGDGPQRDELRSMALVKGLTEVHWPGFKYFHELPLYYALAGCFILPSVREPWGLVVNEAMASGLPVLVSNSCGCAPDLVREGENGYTFDPANIGQLVDFMRQISISSFRQLQGMSEASRDIVSQFTLQIWADNLARALSSPQEIASHNQ
jgi:glycosyltransferase involved in cell wall biosynthesis